MNEDNRPFNAPNVVQLQTPKVGDQSFMVCGCNPKDPSPFVPIVLVQQNPIIVGLQCPACETYLMVVNGVVQEPVPKREPTRQEIISKAEDEIGNADLDDGC